MVRYQAGEMEAFERLYRALAPRVRGLIGHQRLDLGAELDDLVQETFLRVHRSRHTYSPGRPVEPWVAAIARHVYLMDRRTRSRKQAREVPAGAGPGGLDRVDALGARRQADPERSALARDRVTRALPETTAKRRASMLLHHLWGFSFREVGRLLGVKPDTAKRRASRGVADLRGALGREPAGRPPGSARGEEPAEQKEEEE